MLRSLWREQKCSTETPNFLETHLELYFLNISSRKTTLMETYSEKHNNFLGSVTTFVFPHSQHQLLPKRTSFTKMRIHYNIETEKWFDQYAWYDLHISIMRSDMNVVAVCLCLGIYLIHQALAAKQFHLIYNSKGLAFGPRFFTDTLKDFQHLAAHPHALQLMLQSNIEYIHKNLWNFERILVHIYICFCSSLYMIIFLLKYTTDWRIHRSKFARDLLLKSESIKEQIWSSHACHARKSKWTLQKAV